MYIVILHPTEVIIVGLFCFVLFFKGHVAAIRDGLGEIYPIVFRLGKVRFRTSNAKTLSEFVAASMEMCPNLPVKVC